ncbi:integral membrane protein, TerC family [Mycobacteroides abscessus subsp. abscessus]|nr:integral membrane protein, TerC family [Mycobacteroides abscessus subsp. abscessus]
MNIAELASTTFTELSLSADNVMVWALIIRQLDIPARMERRVLAAGIAIAFVLRYAAIAAGAVALERFAWLTYVLGAVLVWTGVKIARSGDADDETPGIADRLSRWFKSPVTVAIIALGVTDLVFAVDSIPASFGITRDADIIAIANVIALAALWFMYRAVSALMERLPYLTHGLAVVLVWIGAGMLVHHYIAVPELVNFTVVCGVLGISAAVSIYATRRAVAA